LEGIGDTELSAVAISEGKFLVAQAITYATRFTVSGGDTSQSLAAVFIFGAGISIAWFAFATGAYGQTHKGIDIPWCALLIFVAVISKGIAGVARKADIGAAGLWEAKSSRKATALALIVNFAADTDFFFGTPE
jgi:hypothetical protein